MDNDPRDLFELLRDLIFEVWDEITPKRFRDWLNAKKNPICYILGPVYYTLPHILLPVSLLLQFIGAIVAFTLIGLLWNEFF